MNLLYPIQLEHWSFSYREKLQVSTHMRIRRYDFII